MDSTTPEIVTARAVGVLLVESLIRARTSFVLRVLGGLGVVLILLALLVGDVLGVLFGLLGLVLLVVTGVLVGIRKVSLVALRRIGGGPMHERVRPVVARRLTEIRTAGSELPLTRSGAFQLLRLARRPTELHAQIRTSGEAIVRAVPEVIDEVRAVLDERGIPRERRSP